MKLLIEGQDKKDHPMPAKSLLTHCPIGLAVPPSFLKFSHPLSACFLFPLWVLFLTSLCLSFLKCPHLARFILTLSCTLLTSVTFSTLWLLKRSLHGSHLWNPNHTCKCRTYGDLQPNDPQALTLNMSKKELPFPPSNICSFFSILKKRILLFTELN